MEGFIKKLAEIYAKGGDIARGTAANMKRGLDGTAMEEMQAAERDRNSKMIENAYPGGMRGYMEDNGMMGTTTPTTTAPQRQGGGYLEALRALLNKP